MARVPIVVTVVGALMVVAVAFMPWIQTGHRSRNSFETIRTADLLDLVNGAGRVALRSWYLVPLLAAAVGLAAALDRPRVVVVLGAVLAVAALSASLVVLRSGVHVGPGPYLGAVSGTVTGVGVVLTARSSWRTP